MGLRARVGKLERAAAAGREGAAPAVVFVPDNGRDGGPRTFLSGPGLVVIYDPAAPPAAAGGRP